MMKKIFFITAILLVSVFSLQAQVVTISGGTSKGQLPVDNSDDDYYYSQFIYLGSEINKSGDIKSLTFKLSDPIKNFNQWNNWAVRVAETTASSFTKVSSFPDEFAPRNATFTEVHDGVVTHNSSNNTIKVTFDLSTFTYDTTKNLLVEIYEKSSGYLLVTSNKFEAKSTSGVRGIAGGESSIRTYTETSNLDRGLEYVPAVDIEFESASTGGAPLEYCEGDKIELTSAGSTTGGTYKWTKGTSTTELEDEADFTVTNSAATSHAGTYKLQITKDGCTSDVAEIEVVVNPKPTNITLTNDATSNTICAGQSIKFTASATNGAEYEFFVNNVKKQNKSATKTFTTTALNNNDKVKVKVYTAKGCSDESGETTITVNPEPTIPNIAAANASICASENAVFNITGGDSEAVVTYKVGTGSDKTITLSTSGTGTITVLKADLTPTTKVTITKVATKVGCEKTVTGKSATVTVKPLPEVTDLTVDNATVCAPDAGQDVTFTITGTVGATVSYTLTDVTGTPTKTIGSGGTVDIKVTNAKVSQTITLTKVVNNGCIGTIVSGKETKKATVTIKPKAIIKKKL